MTSCSVGVTGDNCGSDRDDITNVLPSTYFPVPLSTSFLW